MAAVATPGFCFGKPRRLTFQKKTQWHDPVLRGSVVRTGPERLSYVKIYSASERRPQQNKRFTRFFFLALGCRSQLRISCQPICNAQVRRPTSHGGGYR